MAGISRDGRIRVFAVLITFSGVPPGRGRCGNFPPHTHKVIGQPLQLVPPFSPPIFRSSYKRLPSIHLHLARGCVLAAPPCHPRLGLFLLLLVEPIKPRKGKVGGVGRGYLVHPRLALDGALCHCSRLVVPRLLNRARVSASACVATPRERIPNLWVHVLPAYCRLCGAKRLPDDALR